MPASMEPDLMSSSIEELPYSSILPEKAIKRATSTRVEPELLLEPIQPSQGLLHVDTNQHGAPTICWAKDIEDIRDIVNAIPFHLLQRRLFDRDPKNPLPLSKFGLRYTPEPAGVNVERRTVMVVGLPVHTGIDQVIASVHVGPIFSAVMCDTVALVGSMTALITFAEPQGAADFAKAAETEGFYIGFEQYEVQPIPSATYPINPTMNALIHLQGYSRILAISNPKKDKALKKRIHAVLSHSSVASRLEGFGKHHCPDKVIVRFVSIEAAVHGHWILKRDVAICDRLVEFVPDV
ncbi:unnamed protein product [Penicillium glandicola]